jgi:hypothetical protein
MAGRIRSYEYGGADDLGGELKLETAVHLKLQEDAHQILVSVRRGI